MLTFTELQRRTHALACLDCGKCTSTCPLAAHGRFSARTMVREEHDATHAPERDPAGRCLTCGACEVRCPEGVHLSGFVRGVRELRTSHPPTPHGGVFQAASRSTCGPEPVGRDLSWIGSDLRTAREGPVALFVGCLPLFDLFFGDDLGVPLLDIARSAIRTLNHFGIEPVVAEAERCCGHDLLWGGDRESFDSLARHNARTFNEAGVEHVVTACAECCRTWRSDYPEVVPDYRPRVEHMAEFLHRQTGGDATPFRDGPPRRLTYHDPCRLGRQLGVFDEPRSVLGSIPGASVLEMERSGRDAVCCGTCGFVHCDQTSRALQAERLEEAAATGADTLVTACPKCLIHLSCARAEARRRGDESPSIEVQDLTVLTANRLRESTGALNRTPVPAGHASGDTP